MNYRLSRPQGRDYYIDAFQSMWFPYCLDRWGLVDANYLCFPCAYRMNTDDGYLPQAFFDGEYIGASGNSNGNDLFFENGKVVSFFVLIDSERKQGSADYAAKMELFFFIDRSLITPAGITTAAKDTERMDEQVMNDIVTFITSNGCCMSVVDVSRDIDKVLERYSGSAKRNALTRNMQGNDNISPSFLAVKVIVELLYSPTMTTITPIYPN